LSSRPIVIESTSAINIKVAENNTHALVIACDGRGGIDVPVGGVVKIQKAQNKLRLIHPLDYNYFATLRSKLHWEQ
jgi:NAD+ kinase